MIPLIAVAHGSRDPRSAQAMAAALASLRVRNPDWDVRLAFLDLNAPSVGQVLDAVVTNVVDFGAFARIGEGLEGLVHISEFPEERKAGFTRATEMIEPGETVSVCIVRIDSANHRLGLSMRLPGDDAPASDEEPATYDDAGSAPADHNNLIF